MGRRKVNVTCDTNVLVRAVVLDDPDQTKTAQALLAEATLLAIPVTVLAEFAWVLKRTYRQTDAAVVDAISAICETAVVATDVAAVEAGLAILRAGGDFADGAIAFEGMSLGGTIFASFDRQAVALSNRAGIAAATPEKLLNPS